MDKSSHVIKRQFSKSAFLVAGVYAVFGSLWILFSDSILNATVSDPQKISAIQTYKGWFYILVTAILVYFLVNRMERRLRAYLKKLTLRNRELNQEISRRQQAERQLQELMKSLELKNKELQTVVYVASHDLRSPLVNLQGFSVELKKDCQKLQQIIKEYNIKGAESKIAKLTEGSIPESLHFITSSTNKMEALLNGLLAVSRTGTVEFNIQQVDVNAVVENVLKNLNYEIKSADIDVCVEPMPPCYADGHQLDQVFSNLIGNAVKYIDPERKGQITISGKTLDGICQYCVEDNGIGISENHQKKIFELFHRLNPEGPTNGQGLGLTLVSRILERMGGSIRLQSEPDKGAKFFIELPNSCVP